jgi:hypothetical protein
MHTVRPVVRVIGVSALGLAVLVGCTGGPGRPPRPTTTATTTTTAPDTSPVPGVARLKDFSARLDEHAAGGPRIIVSGTVTVWSPAYSPTLVPANPQGFNPRILLLRVEVTRSDRIVPQVAVDRTVELVVSPSYDRVDILDFGVSLPVTSEH